MKIAKIKSKKSGLTCEVVPVEEDIDELLDEAPVKLLEKHPIADLHCSVETPIVVRL